MPRGVPRVKSQAEQDLRTNVNSFLKKGGVSRKTANAIHEAVEAVVEQARKDALQQFEDEGEGGAGEPAVQDLVQAEKSPYGVVDED
jgi:hypothetical protein